MKKVIILLLAITLFACEETIVEPIEKTQIIELGTWNMNEIPSHWISYYNPNIESIDCFIYSDDTNIKTLKLDSWDSSISDFKGTVQYVENQIIIQRSEDGFFDSEFYESQTVNRGYLVIKYN